MVWTLIEPGVAIIASSLATIRPLLRAMGIRGFQFTEHSSSNARPRAFSGTHPKTNQSSNDARRSCIGSADVTLSDIELAHTKGRSTRSSSDAGTLASRGLPPKFSSARRMSRVEETRDTNRAPPPPPLRLNVTSDNSNDDGGNGEVKSLEDGYRRVEIRRNEMSTVNNNNANNNHPARPQTLHPGPTWLDSADRLSQFSSRDSSVDYSGLQPQHSPLPVGLDSPYNRRSGYLP